MSPVFFDAYFKPTIRKERTLAEELTKIDHKEADAIMEFTTSWHEKGRAEEKIEVAKRMLCDEVDIATISKFTGLRPDKIEKLKKQLSGNKHQQLTIPR